MVIGIYWQAEILTILKWDVINQWVIVYPLRSYLLMKTTEFIIYLRFNICFHITLMIFIIEKDLGA